MPDVPDLLIASLLAVLVIALGETLRALLTGELFVPPRSRPALQFDWALLIAALAFILLNVLPLLVLPFLASKEPADAHRAPSSRAIEAEILTKFFVIAVMISLIVARHKNQLADYGIDWQGWVSEMRWGGLGFLASVPFVLTLLVLTTRWRSPETQNPLLILLHQTGSSRTLVEVVFAAVISAPLSEELLFRVALQGQLETRLPRSWSIAIPAVVFAGVHGPYDALPLLPLALVLGLLYHFRRSYVATVTAHSLFNAAFLVLALSQR
jgi:membrane protease YdiL (CAAX protease family)